MADLEQKASERSFTNKEKSKKKAPKLISKDKLPSTSSFDAEKPSVEKPVEESKASKIIIGDTASAGPFVKEQTIKLNPNAGERGTGPGSQAGAGTTIGSRTKQKKRSQISHIERMGGRHSSGNYR